jgi:hypothetical protein
VTWIELAFAIVVCGAVVGGSGALIALALRLRGLWLAGTAPVLGVTAVVAASVLASWLSITWSVWVVLATALIMATIARIGSSLAPALRPHLISGGWRWAAPIAAVSAAILLSARVLIAIGSPELFAQAGDNVFHLNAVRWILDHGDAAPWSLTGLSGGGVYPDAWHALVSLVCQLTGVAIPVASNAALVVVACGIWPLGVVLLTRVLFGSGTPVIIASGIASAGFATYPLLLLPYMGTYPLVMAIALVAPVLATIVEAFRLGHDRLGVGASIVVAAIALPGLACAHPSALVMLAVMSAPCALVAAWSVRRDRSRRRRLTWWVCGVYVVSVATILIAVRPGGTQPDSLRFTAAQAWGEVLLGGFAAQPVPVVMTVLMIVGTLAAVRRDRAPGWTAVGIWGVVGAIYVAAAGSDEFVHLLFSTPWFGDATRVAAFAPIGVAPLAARGAAAIWAWGTASLPGRFRFAEHGRRRIGLAVVVFIALAGLLLSATAVRSSTIWARMMFQPTDNVLTSPIPLTADDRAIFEWVSQNVPERDLLAGDPWNGTGFAYALTGRPVLVRQMLQPIEGTTKTFLDGFSTSAPAGPGCRAARELGVRWILDLHPGKRLPNRPHYVGMDSLESSPNVRRAHQVGDSSIYEVVGCGVE